MYKKKLNVFENLGKNSKKRLKTFNKSQRVKHRAVD